MYAVLKTGGKQYKVSQNDVIIVERLNGESGSKINLDKVLMIGEGENTTVGTPTIDGALVSAEVLEHKRGDKITVFKKKRSSWILKTSCWKNLDLMKSLVLTLVQLGTMLRI